MLLKIDHRNGVPIYRQIIEQIRQQIMTNVLKHQEQLETVRDLSARLKVNPMTISKAYSHLELQGLVTRKRGIGLFVAKIEQSKQTKIKLEILNNIMEQAAITAVQLGLSQTEAINSLKKHLQQYQNKNWRQQ